MPGPFMWLNHWIPWRDPNNPNLGNFIVSDQMDQFYPMLNYIKQSISNGDIPFWNSSMAFGTPFASMFIVGHLFPLSALALLFPIAYVWGILAIFKIIFMGFFTYKLLRLYSIKENASLYGSLILSFSYYSTVWTGDFLSYSFSAIPFFLYSITLFYRFGSTRISKFLLYLSSICLILGAFPSVSFYGVFVGCLYILFLFGTRLFSRDGLQLIFIGILAALTCCIPLFYTGEYLSLIDLSWRAKYGHVHLPNRDALLLLFPEYFGEYAEMIRAGYGNFNEKTGYFGIFAFFLTCASLFFLCFDAEYRKKKIVWFWTIVQFWSVSMVYGYFGVLGVFGKLPIFNSNSGTRLLSIVVISSTIIASNLLSWLQKSNKEKPDKLVKFLISVFLFSIFILFVLMHEVYNLRNPWHVFAQSCVLAVSIGLVISTILSNSIRIKNFSILLITVISFLNLRYLGKDYNSYYKPEDFYRVTPSIQFLLENQTDSSKLLTMDKNMLPQTPIFFGLSSIEARWFVTQTQKELLQELDPSYRVNHNTQHFFRDIDLAKADPILDFLNVRYMMYETAVAEITPIPEGWSKTESFLDEVSLIENIDRPYTTSEPNETCDDDKLYNYFYKNDVIRLTSNRCTEGKWKLPIWAYPGWKLANTSNKQALLRSNNGFLELLLPKGLTDIELNFRPSNLGILFLLTIASLLLSFAFIFIKKN
ncbi:MAG: hypothetical protein KDD56_01805 [Bdellovibrionales bacterium]|nr:hypothetical protein [Bdellovibrionales bacterium]